MSNISKALRQDDTEVKSWRLKEEEELRIEVSLKEEIEVKLLKGTAEIFGTEIALDQTLRFRGAKVAIFTWHSAEIEIKGVCHAYVASETPMNVYMNVHATLDARREDALQRALQEALPDASPIACGPRVLIAGATDTGKSSLAKILTGYACRSGREPIFVDLDIGQGSITIPGTIAAVPVDRPYHPESGFMAAPLCFFYGHTSLDKNVDLYKSQMLHLNEQLKARTEISPELGASGLIINSCGWVTDTGYDILLASIRSFHVDVVLVLDNERLASDLQQAVGSNISIVKLPKSGGTVTRDRDYRRDTRDRRIREYFYGPKEDLFPHQVVIPFAKLNIFKVGDGAPPPAYSLPIGVTASHDPLKLSPVTPTTAMIHSILCITHCKSVESALESNVAGFLYITDVNVTKKTVTALAPCPGPPPSYISLLGSLKWIES